VARVVEVRRDFTLEPEPDEGAPFAARSDDEFDAVNLTRINAFVARVATGKSDFYKVQREVSRDASCSNYWPRAGSALRLRTIPGNPCTNAAPRQPDRRARGTANSLQLRALVWA
jgi:hypothetical protein